MKKDLRLKYRGRKGSRMNGLTDTVFGLAITLLIFNIANPNSFQDLLTFTTTLPGFLIGITLIMLIWKEHKDFSEIYSLDDSTLTVLNILFLALVIFYTYPLRFLTLLLTGIVFDSSITISILEKEVPFLMIYYGAFAFSIYFVLYLFYRRASKLENELNLNQFEIFFSQQQMQKMKILFSVPLISIVLILAIRNFSTKWALGIGGFAYWLYMPLIFGWMKRYKRDAKKFIPTIKMDNDENITKNL